MVAGEPRTAGDLDLAVDPWDRAPERGTQPHAASGAVPRRANRRLLGMGPFWVGTLAILTPPASCRRLADVSNRETRSSVQVTNVRTTVVGTPWRDLVFVELETDTGLVGVGEVRPVNKTDSFVAVVGELAARYVVGADPFDTERLAWAIERLEYGRPGEHSQSALAAFDVASWDLIGQQLGVPIWRLLGGRFRDRIPAYANGWYQADLEPETIATLAVGVVARGYGAMKLDPFGAASVRLTAAARRRADPGGGAGRGAGGPARGP